MDEFKTKEYKREGVALVNAQPSSLESYKKQKSRNKAIDAALNDINTLKEQVLKLTQQVEELQKPKTTRKRGTKK